MKSQLLLTISVPRVNLPSIRLSTYPRKRSSFMANAHSQLTILESLACGAIGRATQIMVMFPVDTIKTRVQVSRVAVAKGTSSLSRMASAIQQGNLYRGAAFSLIGQIPYGMLTFGIYENLLSYLSDVTPPSCPGWLRIMTAAAVGDAIGSLWLTPSEVIKSKTQAGIYNSPIAAVSALSKKGLPSFYQGYIAAIARDIPFRALQFVLFDRFKLWYTERIKKSTIKNISPIENLFLGAIAGTITAATTTPLDVIRTRMMSQGLGQAALYTNALDCVIKTVSKEGATALFKGIVPRCLLIGPSSAVFFLAYETSKSFFRNRSRGKTPSQVANVAICSRRRYRFA